VGVKGLIFIDSNQYLDLYRTTSGKKLLAPLQEQRDYILVTTQVVEEVHRQKLNVTASFLADWLKKLEPNSIDVPDHLLSTLDDNVVRRREQFQKIRETVKETKGKFKKLTPDLLEQVSQSKDGVSKVLDGIFSKAIAHNEGELQRARARKERGNPPGKKSDPLGDEISWEQILSQCQDKPRLWIITNDSDYCTKHKGKMFLNAFLYQELARLYQSEPTVFCFDNIADGLKHFADTTGAKAENLPTPEETEQIKKEQESLPPLGWLTNYDDSNMIAIQSAYIMRNSTLLRAALASQIISEDVFPPPAAKEADKDGT
jgi:hypothetical protein